MKPQSLFVTGTDTGVGKTVVTALLALHFQAQSVDVGIMKPFATECQLVNGEWVNEDARWLKEITGVGDELQLINPAQWEEPLAPLVAARRAGNAHHDWIETCLDAFVTLSSRHEVMIVEGVGGLLVPLQEQRKDITLPTCAEFAAELELPICLVARRALGTINHTLLTTRYPLQAPAHFAGLVFSDSSPMDESDVAVQTSPDLIAEITGLPIWGRVPFLTDLSRPAMQQAAAKQFAAA